MPLFKRKPWTGKTELLFSDKALTALILPLFLEQLLSVLVGLSDSIMVAQVGEAAVSAVSLVDSIAILLINIFNALATGGAVVSGQYLGARDKKKAAYAGRQMMQFMVWMSIAIMLLIYLGKYFILHTVFGSIEADVMANCNTYLLISAASIPFLGVYCGGAALFRAMGNSKTSMYVSCIMNVINVSGNAILVFGFHRGVEGVAIPTLLSRVIAAFLMVWLLHDEKHVLTLKGMNLFKFDGKMIRRILHIGVPNGIENSMFQLGKVLVLSLVSTFGTYAIAANAVSNVITLFSILPGQAICLAVTTVIARCVGAGDYEQAKYYNKKLILLTHIGMAITISIVFITLPFILKVYNLSEAASEATRHIIWFHGCCAVLIWAESFTLPATFRACGDAKACMIISTVSMWIFRVGASYILGRNLGLGVFGVWVAMIIDWAFRSLLFGIRYFSGKWKKHALVS